MGHHAGRLGPGLSVRTVCYCRNVDDGALTQIRPILFTGPWASLELALALRLDDLRRVDPLRPLVVLCGSSASATHVRRRVARVLADRAAPRKGLAGVSFTTIHRLATDMLLAAGEGGAARLSSVEELRLIAGVVADRAAGTYFAPIAAAPGLPRALRRTFKDLREARLLPADLAPHAGDPGVAGVAELYEEYLSRLSACGRLDDPTLYAQAAGVVQRSPGLVSATWAGVYGLYDLPATQREFIRALAGCRDLDAFVPGPGDAEYSGEAREFFASLECAPAPAPPQAGERGGVQLEIVSVENGTAERAEVLRRLLAAADPGPDGPGRRFHEIAVVHADPAWRGLLVEDLEREGIPVAARVRRPTPGGRAVTGLLDCLLPAVGLPFERATVIELAAVRASFVDAAAARSGAGYRGKMTAQVARWDRLSREAHVVGRAHGWRARVDGMLERSGRDRGRSTADALLGFVDCLTTLLESAAGLTTWPALAHWLGGALDMVEVPADDDIRSLVSELAAVDDVEAGVTTDTFAATVRALVGERRTVLGSLGRTGVAVVSPQEVRGLSVPLVLFGGLVEGLFPPAPSPDPLFGDVHRRALSEATGRRLSTSGLRGEESDLLFALTCETATERVVFLRARSKDGTGAPQLPSRHLVDLVRRRVPREDFRLSLVDDGGERGGLSVVRVPATTLADAGLPGEVAGAERRAADAATLSRLAGDHGSSRQVVEEYLAAVLGDAAAAGRRLEALRSRRRAALTPWDGVIGDPGLRESVFDRLLSVSAVQDYLSCPFVFFMRRVLHADALEEPEEVFDISTADLGLLAHRVLQRVFESARAVADPGIALSAFDDVAEEEFARGVAEGVTGFALAWEGKRRQLAADLRRAVENDPCWHDELRPALFEWEFGSPEPVPEVQAGGRTLRFRGIVDRIDIDPGHTAARVIDYKTGKGEVQRKAVGDGSDIQLPLYRLAAGLLLPDADELSCRYRFVTRQSGFRDDVELAGDADQCRQALCQTLAPFVAGVEQGLFVRRHDSSRCRWCDLAYGCGVPAPTDAAKTAAVEQLVGAEAPAGGADQ